MTSDYVWLFFKISDIKVMLLNLILSFFSPDTVIVWNFCMCDLRVVVAFFVFVNKHSTILIKSLRECGV